MPTGQELQALHLLDRIGTVGLGFIVLCLMRGWLVTRRELTQQRVDFERRYEDLEEKCKEIAGLYRERLDTANTAAAEWRMSAYKAMGVVESKQG